MRSRPRLRCAAARRGRLRFGTRGGHVTLVGPLEARKYGGFRILSDCPVISRSAGVPERSNYDVIVIGSGFGGSVAALRLTEKGYRVGVLEAGRRFADDELPR